jgi:hypothetical protein
MRQEEFLRIFSAQDLPTNWLVGIIDGEGRFIARHPKGSTEVGQFASQAWRATKDRTGVFAYTSLEGDAIINANAHPSIGSWTVGVAVKKAELRGLAWNAVRWSAMLGAGLSAASLLLAGAIARQITRPIDQLRQSFADVSGEPNKPIAIGPPEIMQLQDTLYWQSTGQTRIRRSRLLFPSLNKRWSCARKHRQRWRKHSAWRQSVSSRVVWRTTSTMCWRLFLATWMWSPSQQRREDP